MDIVSIVQIQSREKLLSFILRLICIAIRHVGVPRLGSVQYDLVRLSRAQALALLPKAMPDMDVGPSAFEGKPTDFEAFIADPGICLNLDFPAPDFDTNLIVPEGTDGDFGFLSTLGGEAGSPASLSCLEEHRTPTAPLAHPIDVPQGHPFDPKCSGMTIPLEGRPPSTHTSAQSRSENEASVESENNIDLNSFLMSGTGPRSPLTLPMTASAQSAMPKGENEMSNMPLSSFVPTQEKELKEAKSRRDFDPASISFLFDNHSTGSVLKEDDILAYFGSSEVYTLKGEPALAKKHAGVKKKAGTNSKKKAKKGVKKAPPRAKKAKQPVQSSKHCHICARSGQKSNLAGCKNLRREPDACRKVVCRKCFAILEGVGTFEAATWPGQEWECLHCMVPEGEGCAPGDWCPGHAQCKIYAKTNARRRSENLRKKRLRDAQEKGWAEGRKMARTEKIEQRVLVTGEGEDQKEEMAEAKGEETKMTEVDTCGTGIDDRGVVLSPFGNGRAECEIEKMSLAMTTYGGEDWGTVE